MFVFLTDNELGYQHPDGLLFGDYKEFSSRADLLIHDGEYTADEYKATKRRGHSAYTTALDLQFQPRLKLGLFHLNQERTDDEVDRMAEDCHKKGSNGECFAAGSDMIFILQPTVPFSIMLTESS